MERFGVEMSADHAAVLNTLIKLLEHPAEPVCLSVVVCHCVSCCVSIVWVCVCVLVCRFASVRR